MTAQNDIRLLATDLDGTLLDGRHRLSPENKRALEALAEKGVIIAAATGRARTSISEEVLGIKGMKYLITANGAKTFLLNGGAGSAADGAEEIIHASYLSPEAVSYASPFFADKTVLCEVFWDGVPHVEESRFAAAEGYGIPFWFSDYFFKSRVPTENFEARIQAHIGEIENINFVFRGEADKARVHAFLLARRDLYELTTSLAFNYEIGGKGVSKGAALEFIAGREHIARSQTIAFGDNENDIAMLKYAGVAIATKNAVPSVIEAAGYITKDNNDSAIAHALKELGLI